MKRRNFLLLAGATLIPVGCNSWVARSDSATKSSPRLITIFLRGAIDGLSVVIPHQEEEYFDARPTIALPYPQESGGMLDLDGFFGLHPALSDLMPLWQKRNLAFVHACGSPDSTRSHFDAQDYMESGTPGQKKTTDGWMNRLLALLAEANPTQAVSLGGDIPKILEGKMPVANVARGNLASVALAIDRPVINNAFDRLYSGKDALSLAYQEGDRAREIVLKDLSQEMMSASKGAPSSQNLVIDAAKIAKLMRGDAKTQLAFMDIGGWDTHINQKDYLNRSLKALGEGLSTLARELDDLYSRTIILVMSEFGRTFAENGNNGTDHGHGNVMFVLGGGIKGGKVYGKWPGLAESELYEKRDLAITTDFRDVIASTLVPHLKLSNAHLKKIFPNYSLGKNLNLLA